MYTQSNANKYFDPLAVTRLPARLNADHAARLLGFHAHDIPVLVGAKLLQPLGKPMPNAVKYFATVALEELRCEKAWMDAATKAVSRHWQIQNSHKRNRATTSPLSPS